MSQTFSSELIPRILKESLPVLRRNLSVLDCRKALICGKPIDAWDWEIQKEAFEVLALSIDRLISYWRYSEEETAAYFRESREGKA